jgi:hypothetical protein
MVRRRAANQGAAVTLEIRGYLRHSVAEAGFDDEWHGFPHAIRFCVRLVSVR